MHRLSPELNAKYKVRITNYTSTCIASSIANLDLKWSHFVILLPPTQYVLVQAIDYLSSFLKVERLSQNLTLQRCAGVHNIRVIFSRDVFSRVHSSVSYNVFGYILQLCHSILLMDCHGMNVC